MAVSASAYHDLAEVADVSNLLADKVLDTLDFGGLLEDEACWWLVKKGAETLHVDSAIFGGKDVDHGLESHVDGSGAYDFGDIRWVCGLEDGNIDTLFKEPSLLLRYEERGVVGVGIPVKEEGGLCSLVRHFEVR